MLARIRRDEAWRSFPVWGVLLILNAGVLVGLMTVIAVERRAPIPPLAIVCLGWFTFALYLVLGGGRARCRTFDLSLPISARRIWIARLAALAAAGTVLVGFCVAMAALPSVTPGGLDVRPQGLAVLGLLLESGMLLAAVLLQLPEPSLARIPVTLRYVAWVLFVLLVVLALLSALSVAGPAGPLVPLLLAAAAFAYGMRSVPEALLVAPTEPTNGRPASRAAVTAPERPGAAEAPGRMSWTARLAAFRCVTARAKEWAVYPIIVLFGLFLGGALEIWRYDAELSDLRVVYVPLAAYTLFSLALPRMALLQDLDPLPIGRRILFAGMVLPSAIALVGSWSAGALLARGFAPRYEYVDFVRNEADGRWSVTVPLGAFRFTWGSRAPIVASPWGETHPAERLPLFRGGQAAIWSPFGAPPGSSSRFVALQLARAAETVYGLTLSPGEIERRFLVTLPDGAVAGREPSLRIRAENPAASPHSWPELPVLMTLALVPWLLLLALLFRTYRSSIPARACHAVYWGGLAVLVLPLPFQAITMIAGISRPWLLRAFLEIPLARLSGGAVATAAAWVIGGLLLAGAYRLAEREFARMEIPAKPLKYSLLEGMREEG